MIKRKTVIARNPTHALWMETVMQKNVIYQAEVTTTTTKLTYIRLCDTTFT